MATTRKRTMRTRRMRRSRWTRAAAPQGYDRASVPAAQDNYIREQLDHFAGEAM